MNTVENKRNSNTKKPHFLFIFVFAVALLIILLISSIYVIFFNPLYYNYLFKHFDVQNELGISNSDLILVRNNIIGYFLFFKGSLQTKVTYGGVVRDFYTSDELAHMHDVRILFMWFLSFFITAVIIIICKILYFYRYRPNKVIKRYTGLSFIIITSIIFAIFVPILFAIAFNFEQTFTLFHEIFFPQGNWEFGNDSLMITLLPPELFLKGALHIGALWALSLFSLFTYGIILVSKNRSRNIKSSESASIS